VISIALMLRLNSVGDNPDWQRVCADRFRCFWR